MPIFKKVTITHNTPNLLPAENSELSRQATPVSQHQVRKRKQHIQFGKLLSQASVVSVRYRKTFEEACVRTGKLAARS